MGFWKTMFGGGEPSEEDERRAAEAKRFDALKYDGARALKTGQAAVAEACLERALAMRPDDLEVRDYLAQTLLRQGRLDEALQHYEALCAAQPTNVRLLSQAAHVAYMAEDYARMADLADRALAVEADNAQLLYQRAEAHLGAGETVSAIALLTRAIALSPELGDARLLRARTLMAMGDAKGAREDAEWLLAHTEDEEDVLLLMARLEKADGRADDALALYDRVVAINPFSADAYRERGQLYYERGDMARAEQDMHQLLELDPQHGADISGEFSAEGIEQRVKQAYRSIDPYGIFGS